jgi:alkylhydroperoxidase/carboxymuconolactone decarboxylase family protein YurZ
MLFEWNAYQAELTKSIPEFAKLSRFVQGLSDSFRSEFEDEKVRQLISLAVAVTTP